MDAWNLPSALTALAVALGCGLLVGIERERRKGEGLARAFAGLRTFALTCVLGALAALLPWSGLVPVGALSVAALAVAAHLRARSQDPGLTTEVALLLTYLIGVSAVGQPALAAALATALTVLLAGRQRLHHLSRRVLLAGEMRDGLVLATLVLIALPLLPDRPLWGPVLNPHRLLQLLVLLLSIQALAHGLQRLLRARRQVQLWSALASGFVSSSGAIAQHGLAVRQGVGSPRTEAAAGVLSSVSTLLLVPLLAANIGGSGALALVLGPGLAGAALALAWGLWLLYDGQPAAAAAPRPEDRMFDLRRALWVALALGGVQALVQGLGLWLGEAGLLVAVGTASWVELHASVAAVISATWPDQPQRTVLALALALTVHALGKCLNAGLSGGWNYLRWLAPAVLLQTAVAVLWLWLA